MKLSTISLALAFALSVSAIPVAEPVFNFNGLTVYRRDCDESAFGSPSDKRSLSQECVCEALTAEEEETDAEEAEGSTASDKKRDLVHKILKRCPSTSTASDPDDGSGDSD